MFSHYRTACRAALEHPLTRGRNLDDATTSERRRRIIHGKKSLYNIYADWYRLIAQRIPGGFGAVLELGSGGGFLRHQVPDVISSEVLNLPGVDVVCSGMEMPFATGSLRAILLTDVLHHLPDVERFFQSASRCLRPGGRIVMIEPWPTTLSRIVYRWLHHEPFDSTVKDWKFSATGPLSSANGALPWMVFERDLARFTTLFPELRLREIHPLMPVRYLFSGGVGFRLGAPVWLDQMLRRMEMDLCLLRSMAAMFARLVVERE